MSTLFYETDHLDELYHWNPFKGKEKKEHKYVARVELGNGKYRYFYSQAEYMAYKVGKGLSDAGKGVADAASTAGKSIAGAANTAGKAISSTAKGAVDYARDKIGLADRDDIAAYESRRDKAQIQYNDFIYGKAKPSYERTGAYTGNYLGKRVSRDQAQVDDAKERYGKTAAGTVENAAKATGKAVGSAAKSVGNVAKAVGKTVQSAPRNIANAAKATAESVYKNSGLPLRPKVAKANHEYDVTKRDYENYVSNSRVTPSTANRRPNEYTARAKYNNVIDAKLRADVTARKYGETIVGRAENATKAVGSIVSKAGTAVVSSVRSGQEFVGRFGLTKYTVHENGKTITWYQIGKHEKIKTGQKTKTTFHN